MELLLITSPLILFFALVTFALIASVKNKKDFNKKPLVILNTVNSDIEKCPVFKNNIYLIPNDGIKLDSNSFNKVLEKRLKDINSEQGYVKRQIM